MPWCSPASRLERIHLQSVCTSEDWQWRFFIRFHCMLQRRYPSGAISALLGSVGGIGFSSGYHGSVYGVLLGVYVRYIHFYRDMSRSQGMESEATSYSTNTLS